MGKNKRKYPDQSDEDKLKKKLATIQKKSSKTVSPEVQKLKAKAAGVVDNRKNANDILDIASHLELDEPGPTAAAAVQGLKRIFTLAIEKRDLGDVAGEAAEMSADDKYKAWMSERFGEVVKKLCTLIHHPKGTVSNLCISTLMSFLTTLWTSSGSSADDWGAKEKEILNNIVLATISNKHQSKSVISRLQEYLLYVDVKYHFLKQLNKIIGVAMKGEKANPVFVENVLTFLEIVSMEDIDSDESKANTFLCKDLTTGQSQYKFDAQELKRNFSNCWLQILKSRISLDQYKRVLLIMDERVLPHLSRPLLMTDFLISSYNVGGSISLLALAGVFTLISRYNLEYPEFYTKLYQLFTPELLHVKYKARFFHLADIFLSSTHLPAYLVAAFVKRLARLCLTAPSCTVPMVVRFIHNLLHRHPSLAKMIDNPDPQLGEIEDPFDNEEKDPAKCGAANSSLWEIVTLQEHVLPQVSSVAKDLIEKGLREMELDFSSHLETTYQELFEKETKKKIFTNVPVNWELPDGFKIPKDDIFSQIIEV